MFHFVWIAQDFVSWGESAAEATWAACMELAQLYAAEGATTSLCYMVGG